MNQPSHHWRPKITQVGREEQRNKCDLAVEECLWSKVGIYAMRILRRD